MKILPNQINTIGSISGQVLVSTGTSGESIWATVPGGVASGDSNSITNVSTVSGITLTDALDTLQANKIDKVFTAPSGNIAIFDGTGNVMDGGLPGGDTSAITNSSTVSGLTLTDALDNLNANKMDKVYTAISGHLAIFDAAGQVIDGGIYAVSTPQRTIVNGPATDFDLAGTPLANTLAVYRNGLLQEPTDDYTLAGVTVTFVSALITNERATALYSI